MEALLLCVALPILGVGGLILFPLPAALRAWRLGRRATGEQRATLHFLAVFLAEPAVNTALVTFLFARGESTYSDDPVATALRVTLPMAILLLPIFGLRFRDLDYREACVTMLCFGVARWVLSFIGLAFARQLLFFITVPLGIGVLFWSIHRGRTLLQGPVAWIPLVPAPFPPAQPIVAVPVALAPAAPPRHGGPPVPCPVCRTPVPLDDDGCRGCGLVFQSRIPAPLGRLAAYAPLRPLSPGGMGSVYLAEARHDGLLYVLKTVDSVDAADPRWRVEAAACLRCEADLLAELDHPQIVRLVDRSLEAEEGCLVLDYVAGPNLEHRLETAAGPLPLAEALGYGAATAAVLSYLAARQPPVLHLDLKPANLIVPAAGGAPVLVDFGSATRHDPAGARQLAPGAGFGTPGYAAPEQYAGQPSPASDVYGLGATLYHLLTGDDPCEHPLSFPLLDRLPPPVATLLAEALARDPGARPSAAVLAETLQALVAPASPPRQL